MAELELELGAGSVRVGWDPDCGADEGAITVEPEPSANGPAALVRVLAGRLADGGALLLASARPAGATDHGDDVTDAVRIDGEGEETRFERGLLSVELSASGEPRRLTIELDPGGDAIPFRGAADAAGEPIGPPGSGVWATEVELRLEGESGSARFEVHSA